MLAIAVSNNEIEAAVTKGTWLNACNTNKCEAVAVLPPERVAVAVTYFPPSAPRLVTSALVNTYSQVVAVKGTTTPVAGMIPNAKTTLAPVAFVPVIFVV